MTYPRDLDTINLAAKKLLADRGVKLAGRNRRNADMLRALADIEQFEREITACDQALEGLFDERAAAHIRDLADRLVRP